jgi:5'-methylthioadenosine phosphorylase
VLAAELGVPYAAIALVTDYDAGIDGAEPVSQEVVFAVLARNVDRVRALLERVIPDLP